MLRSYTLTVPGYHESEALADHCGTCGAVRRPTVVLDREDRTREAAYDCRCGNRWVGAWEPA